MSGWKEISSAPKDGTEFLARWPQQGNVVQLISWNIIHGYWQSKGTQHPHLQATLWAPIPAFLGEDDICGLCGETGADKMPHPIHWPGERVPETDIVHAECEQEECRRAHAALNTQQRERFLRNC